MDVGRQTVSDDARRRDDRRRRARSAKENGVSTIAFVRARVRVSMSRTVGCYLNDR